MAVVPDLIHRLADRLRGHFHGKADGTPQPGASGRGKAAPAQNTIGDARKDGYVSEFTDFMEHFLEDHPDVTQDQHRGWSIWWNRKVDFQDLVKASKDAVPAAGYYYFDNPPVSGPERKDNSPGTQHAGRHSEH